MRFAKATIASLGKQLQSAKGPPSPWTTKPNVADFAAMLKWPPECEPNPQARDPEIKKVLFYLVREPTFFVLL
jgi:hypothetical protein